MIDYSQFIKRLGKSYQLHIETSGCSAKNLHERFRDDFQKAMHLRHIRRVRPTYIRLVNIEDHTENLKRQGFRYVSDLVTPSLALIAEMCPLGPVDIMAPKLNAYQIMRCFDWAIKVDTIDPVSQRIITPMHPLVIMNNLLSAYPKQIQSFHFRLTHSVYMTPSIDDDDYFRNDPMPFKYKRVTKFQQITFLENR